MQCKQVRAKLLGSLFQAFFTARKIHDEKRGNNLHDDKTNRLCDTSREAMQLSFLRPSCLDSAGAFKQKSCHLYSQLVLATNCAYNDPALPFGCTVCVSVYSVRRSNMHS